MCRVDCRKKALCLSFMEGITMFGTVTASATTYPKSRPIDDVKTRLVQAKTKEFTPAIVLDMGEASREEGFRLNGCR